MKIFGMVRGVLNTLGIYGIEDNLMVFFLNVKYIKIFE
jgi:hypothetical protein